MSSLMGFIAVVGSATEQVLATWSITTGFLVSS